MAKAKAKTKTPPKTKRAATKPKAKAKTTAKRALKPKGAATPTIAAPTGPATYFDDLVWGMPMADVAKRYGLKVTPGAPYLAESRTLAGVRVSVRYRFEGGMLSHIDVGGVRRYEGWGDGDADEGALVGWVRQRAGAPTKREAASAKWLLPTATIWTYCDESLGLYFERPTAT
jgi:hypothetical protein